MRKIYITLIWCTLLFTKMIAQTYTMANGTVNTCSGTFYDAGGSGSNYSNNSSITETFCSTSGNCIRAAFSSFSTQNGVDYLYIYDGPTVDYPEIGAYSGGTSPGTITSTNGCLTFYFTSNGSTTGSGWTATISCTSCPSPSSYADCGSPLPICAASNFSISANGAGNISDLGECTVSNPCTNPASANGGCLMTDEINATWILLKIQASGTLEFSFGALGTQAGYYDWALWLYSAGACSNIALNTLAPLRCNYNGVTTGGTGIATVANRPSGGDASNYEPALNVTAGQQYLICFSNFSGVTATVPMAFYGTATLDCSILPVELLDFGAICNNGNVSLFWSTASETNNEGFTIERSVDGINFISIGIINGQGNSSIMHTYQFVDHEIINVIRYYRLKQTDTDGGVAYHKVIYVDCNESPKVEIFPALFEDHLSFAFPGEENIQAMIKIYSTTGQLVFDKLIDSNKGVITENLSSLTSGVYIIKALIGDKCILKKVIKN